MDAGGALDVKTLTNFIEFRSQGDTLAIFIQAIFLGLTVITAIGIVYIIVTICAVIFHHVTFDKRHEHIPRFVITSMAMESSSEEEYDHEELQAIYAMEKRLQRKGEEPVVFFGQQQVKEEKVYSVGPTYSQKTLLLSEFLEHRN